MSQRVWRFYIHTNAQLSQIACFDDPQLSSQAVTEVRWSAGLHCGQEIRWFVLPGTNTDRKYLYTLLHQAKYQPIQEANNAYRRFLRCA